MPEGDVPYKPNEVPEGTEHTRLIKSIDNYIFCKGGDNQTPQFRKEQMFVQMLEGLHDEDEASEVLSCKRQKTSSNIQRII